MSEKKLQLTAAHLRPLVPVAAIALAAIAAWLAWTGWQQMRDAQRGQALQQTRDLVARGTERALAQQQARLRDRLALPSVQAALAAGDLDAAGAAMRSEWPRLERLEILRENMAQHHRIGDAVRQVMQAAKRVGEGMNPRDRCIGKGETGKMGAQQHRLAGFEVLRLGARSQQIVGQ